MFQTISEILKNIGFISGLLGAVVGGVFAIYTSNQAIREEREKEDRQDEKEVQNLLAALGVELGALWSFHQRRIGELVEGLQDGQALEMYYPLTQDYFTIYHQNASKIGKIKDPHLREQIVVAYNKCKKVVDGFKYNNELFLDWQDFSNDAAETQRARAIPKHKEMAAYARLIREDHFELKGYIETLLKALNEREVIT